MKNENNNNNGIDKAFDIDFNNLNRCMEEHNSEYRVPNQVDQVCEKHGLVPHYENINTNELICTRCKKEETDRRTIEKASQGIKNSKTEYFEKRKRGYINKSIIRRGYFEKTFDNFKTFNRSEKNKVYTDTMNYTQDILKGEVMNLVLVGGTGSGKSHLAMSVLNAINKTSSEYKDGQRSCLAVSFDELIRRIRESFTDGQGSKEQMYIDMLIDADVLLIDDIGAETKKSEFNTRVLFAILEKRSEEKTTIFTTNNTMQQLKTLYDARVISRMRANLKVIDFNMVQDYRPHLYSKKGI